MEPSANVLTAATCCDVLAHGSVRAAPAEIASLRQNLGPVPGHPLPTGFLRHADEQTVVGLAAVLQAIATHGLAGQRFTEWGVLASPRYLGRLTLAAAIDRFKTEGAWGVSPHVIPHRMLHSISGAISQVLKIHGPNLGVGGGPGGLLEVFRMAAGMLHGDRLPGLWVVLTGWDPEPIPGEAQPGEARCIGVALALTAPRAYPRGRRLRLTLADQRRTASGKVRGGATPDVLDLDTLLAALDAIDVRSAGVVWQLEDGGRLELEKAEACNSLAGPHGCGFGGGRVGVGSSGAGAEDSP